jgi:hypothetical protein
MAQQIRVGPGVWMRPLIGPNRQRGNVQTGLEEDVVRQIGQGELRRHKALMLALQEHYQVGVALGVVIAARTGTEENGPASVVALRDTRHEALQRLLSGWIYSPVHGNQDYHKLNRDKICYQYKNKQQ